MVQDRVVTRRRAASGDLPGESLDHSLATVLAEPLARGRVIEQLANRVDERFGIVGLDEDARSLRSCR